jgi:hypothetical protein
MAGGTDSILRNLALDEWYKIFIWLGIFGLISALLFTIKITIISNNGLMISSFGIILIGIGEWMKWKYSTSGPIGGPFHSYLSHTKTRTSYLSRRPNGTEALVQLFGVILLLVPIAYFLYFNKVL